MVPRRQNDNHGGAYGPMGREMRGGIPEKEIKVSRYGRQHPQQRMECMGFPSGFRCRGLPAQSTWRKYISDKSNLFINLRLIFIVMLFNNKENLSM